MYKDIVNKILEIIDEDKKQPEFILRNDLNNLLHNKIKGEIEDAYDQGYEACKYDMENDYYYKR